jgi:hypothetical protein
MRRLRTALLALGVAVGGLVLAACAPGANDLTASDAGEPAGFWLGLWHGIITPVTFVISLFNDSVNVYGVHTTATGTTSASCSG